MRVALVFLVFYFLATKFSVWTEESEQKEQNENKEKEQESEKEEKETELDEQETESKEEENVKEEENEEIDKENVNEDEGSQEDGFSFHKFSLPVSGEAKKVVIPNSNPRQSNPNTIDYIGKPDYSFGYGVHDDSSKNSHLRTETRQGNSVHGEYRVLQPDGLVRIVKYFAHPSTGFQAHVTYARY